MSHYSSGASCVSCVFTSFALIRDREASYGPVWTVQWELKTTGCRPKPTYSLFLQIKCVYHSAAFGLQKQSWVIVLGETIWPTKPENTMWLLPKSCPKRWQSSLGGAVWLNERVDQRLLSRLNLSPWNDWTREKWTSISFKLIFLGVLWSPKQKFTALSGEMLLWRQSHIWRLVRIPGNKPNLNPFGFKICNLLELKRFKNSHLNKIITRRNYMGNWTSRLDKNELFLLFHCILFKKIT